MRFGFLDSHSRATSWLFSAGIHTGVLLALYQVVQHLPEKPRLAGKQNVVSLQAQLTRPQTEQPLVEQVQPEVIITPEVARISEKRFTRKPSVAPPPLLEARVTDARAELPLPDLQPVLEPEVAPPEANEAEEQTSAAPPPSEASANSAATPQAAGHEEVTSPRPVESPPPSYPAEARQRGWQGTATLRLTISTSGEVTHLELATSSGHPVLDAAAIRAVRKWRFAPAEHRGQHVLWTGLIPVQFRLN